MSVEHKQEAPSSVRCKVITVSDTRDETTDRSGQLMQQLLKENHHEIIDYEIVKDERGAIEIAIRSGLADESIDAILLNGGTGIAKRDVTIEVVHALLDKEMQGFGELFRLLSYQEDIGTAAILSRATAGVAHNKAIFATPGSSGAVTLAMKRLILPEIGHVIREIRKDL
ncbi:molybdenum cofactor biosynthesis protein B [Gracilibacillus marinus]|jgi:molybdopterin adenylyltransferase|uniref:Molybdenum cofactor biosynthesis protein B n=1 Tax=Gracilibacillus marinus TaxID=630535 RepID=A0ABV8W1L0_9BACI